MPPPTLKGKTGNRLCGEDMRAYMETFADTFLAGKVQFETEILDIQRGAGGSGWEVQVLDLRTGNKAMLSYARIVLCTGVRASGFFAFTAPLLCLIIGMQSSSRSQELVSQGCGTSWLPRTGRAFIQVRITR